MKKRMLTAILIAAMIVSITGCASKDTVGIETVSTEVIALDEGTTITQDLVKEETAESEIQDLVDDNASETELIEESSESEIVEESAETGIIAASDEIYIAGEFQSDEGTVSISMFSYVEADYPNWLGNIRGESSKVDFSLTSNSCYELEKIDTNVYRLCDCDYNNGCAMRDTGYILAVDKEDGKPLVRIYQNNQLVETFYFVRYFDS